MVPQGLLPHALPLSDATRGSGAGKGLPKQAIW